MDNPFSTCTPSTIYKGELSCVMEPPPLTLILTSASGEPSAVVTCTPANLPANASAAELTGTSFRSLALIEETEANTFFLFTDW